MTPGLRPEDVPRVASQNEVRIKNLNHRLDALEESLHQGRALRFANGVWMTLLSLLLLVTVILTTAPGQEALSRLLNTTPQVTGQTAAPVPANSDDFRNFMTIFLAVAAGGIAYMASMMGMRRLENYDTQLSDFRKDQREFERDVEKLVEEQIKRQSDQTQEELRVQIEEKVRKDVHGRMADTDAQLAALKSMSGEIEKKFGWLKGIDPSLLSEYGASISTVHTKVVRVRTH